MRRVGESSGSTAVEGARMRRKRDRLSTRARRWLARSARRRWLSSTAGRDVMGDRASGGIVLARARPAAAVNRSGGDRRQRARYRGRRCRRGRQLRSRYYRRPRASRPPFSHARTMVVGRDGWGEIHFYRPPRFIPYSPRCAGRRACDSYRTAPLRAGSCPGVGGGRVDIPRRNGCIIIIIILISSIHTWAIFFFFNSHYFRVRFFTFPIQVQYTYMMIYYIIYTYYIVQYFFFQSRPGKYGATGGTRGPVVFGGKRVYYIMACRSTAAIRKSDDEKHNRISNCRSDRPWMTMIYTKHAYLLKMDTYIFPHYNILLCCCRYIIYNSRFDRTTTTHYFPRSVSLGNGFVVTIEKRNTIRIYDSIVLLYTMHTIILYNFDEKATSS